MYLVRVVPSSFLLGCKTVQNQFCLLSALKDAFRSGNVPLEVGEIDSRHCLPGSFLFFFCLWRTCSPVSSYVASPECLASVSRLLVACGKQQPLRWNCSKWDLRPQICFISTYRGLFRVSITRFLLGSAVINAIALSAASFSGLKLRIIRILGKLSSIQLICNKQSDL